MYAFSLNARSMKDQGEFKQGEEVPFIVYIDFKDLFGAEQLATVFVMREGFREVNILKRRKFDVDEKLKQDTQIREAVEKGYSIQAFSSH